MNIFLPIRFNVCFGHLKKPSHRDGSSVPTTYVLVKNKKIIFWYVLLSKGLVYSASCQAEYVIKSVYLRLAHMH